MSGRLAIATAEHNFQINVTEEQTDFPMFAMHRSASSGSPSPATLIITGTPTGTMSQSIPLEAGKYANANEFQQAHSHLFAPNYSLSVDNNRLVITSVATGAAVNVSNISVTPTAFAPLLQQFGLRSVDVHSPMRNSPDSSPIRETRPQRNGFPIPGITWSSYEEQLPDEIVRVDIGLKAKGLWIQGRDRNGTDQGLFIFLPYISASRLKFAEYTPPRFEIPDELKDVDRSLIHYEYLDRGEDTDVKRGLDVLTRENANLAIDTVRSSLTIINMERARFGAATNALEHMKAATTVTHENIMSAESRIRDTDMAMAMVDFTKSNILMQAAQAMLAQANQAPQAILQLLR
jgi:flagellin-like hook-associated protein FlgL